MLHLWLVTFQTVLFPPLVRYRMDGKCFLFKNDFFPSPCCAFLMIWYFKKEGFWIDILCILKQTLGLLWKKEIYLKSIKNWAALNLRGIYKCQLLTWSVTADIVNLNVLTYPLQPLLEFLKSHDKIPSPVPYLPTNERTDSQNMLSFSLAAGIWQLVSDLQAC